MIDTIEQLFEYLRTRTPKSSDVRIRSDDLSPRLRNFLNQHSTSDNSGQGGYTYYRGKFLFENITIEYSWIDHIEYCRSISFRLVW